MEIRGCIKKEIQEYLLKWPGFLFQYGTKVLKTHIARETGRSAVAIPLRKRDR